jgi:hypothetical protein
MSGERGGALAGRKRDLGIPFRYADYCEGLRCPLKPWRSRCLRLRNSLEHCNGTKMAQDRDKCSEPHRGDRSSAYWNFLSSSGVTLPFAHPYAQ